MSPLYTLLHTPGFYLLSVCITLQVCAQIVLCAMVLYRNRKPSILMSNLVLLALSMFLFILLLEGLMPFLPSLKGRNIPVTYFFTLPWWPVALLTCVLWCMTIFGYFGQQRYARRHLSFSSIKEALDQLPEGFCFATDDGTVLLANLSINAYCQECTGHPLVQANTFWDTLLAQGEMHEEQLLLTMQSGHTQGIHKDHSLGYHQSLPAYPGAQSTTAEPEGIPAAHDGHAHTGHSGDRLPGAPLCAHGCA